MTPAERRKKEELARAEYAKAVKEAEVGLADAVRDALNDRNDRIEIANRKLTLALRSLKAVSA